MKINKLRITLPAHLAGTAHHDARAIAEAIALQAAKSGSAPDQITVTGNSQTGAQIALAAASQIPSAGGRNGR